MKNFKKRFFLPLSRSFGIILRSKKGFTLIELLVVISIIGLLSSVVLIAFNQSRIKARDSKRKADIFQVRKALESYFQDLAEYPSANTTPNSEVDIQNLKAELVPKYLGHIPNDPKSNLKNYQYVWSSFGNRPLDYGILVPFGNDGGQNCKFRTPGGNDNWFKVGPVKVPDCVYK